MDKHKVASRIACHQVWNITHVPIKLTLAAIHGKHYDTQLGNDSNV
jgi:hypothetical protein